MRTLEPGIEIDSTPSAVWDVLTDFASYPEWNPFMISIAGTLEVGEQLRVTMQPPGSRATTFKPRVLAATPGEGFRWLGRVLMRGVFDGEHELRIEPTEHGVRFVQAERFSGVLLPLLWRSLRTKTKAGFEAMNEALKERVEAQVRCD